MRKVAVLTDSASDIPAELEAQYGVDILPFYITIDGKSYTERLDFGFEEYYKMLLECKDIPVTSQITMMRFEEKFAQYDAEGYTDILYVSINAAGSNTYNAAQMAAKNYAEEHPTSHLRVHIVDSHTYSMPYGMHVCEAARKLQNGAAVEDVVAYLEDKFACMEIALSMYTLKFVKKSGRVSAAAAFAGELLGLRPIINMIDNTTTTVSKVRGDASVMPGLIAFAKTRMTEQSPYSIGCTSMENGKMLAKLCKKEFGYAAEHTFLLGAAVATNTGPDAVAIVYEGAKRR